MAVGFRANYTFPNVTDGFDTMIVGTASTLPIFVPMFLLFIWMVVFISGVIAQQRRSGTADFPMWSTLASLSTLLIALPLTITKGLIGVTTLVIVVVITFFSGLWLFLSQSSREV